MMLRYEIIFVILIFARCLFGDTLTASTLHSISVQNNLNLATVSITCNSIPIYTIFTLHEPERLVVDFLKVSKIHKNIFSVFYDSKCLVKQIRTNFSENCQNMRIVLDLNYPSHIKSVIHKKVGNNYHIVLSISKEMLIRSTSNVKIASSVLKRKNFVSFDRKLLNNQKKVIDQLGRQLVNVNKTQSVIVIAIDAGHGGQDPGATGRNGVYEKDITFNIAKKLKKLLDSDFMFKSFMIRNDDYFLSVTDRSELARKKGANILISIHVDSSLNSKVKGASVWILSDHRAKIETLNWLQRRERYSELLGGIGDILTNYPCDPYFNYLILDLQFGYTQRVGYNVATQILSQLKNVTVLHKNTPEYSNFGVLRAPDIPSILVETGFISNLKEEYLLTTHEYQEKIAQALYKGLRNYFMLHAQRTLNHL